ncbi:MAG: TonB-dependent receptor [Rikenellaceae bacterium]
MRIKTTLFFLLLFGTIAGLSAAPVSITGVVTDATNKDAVIGATVMIEGTQVGTATDYEGRYTISAEPGSVLVFSYLGYESQNMTVTQSQSVMDVLLAEDTEAIEEIVVVGYGVQKKATAVGAVAQVSGEDIIKASGSVTSISSALQGAMPGVVAVDGSSTPGSESSTIYIRGIASWQDSTPLCLVDGVERDFDDVDANEIESISVLKDASATAVYGVKGANGVILITTKRGTVSKPKVNFTANFSFDQPTTTYERTDYLTAMEMWNEACANDLAWESMIPQSTIDAWTYAYANNLTSPTSEIFPDIDWWDTLIDDYGFSQQYNVNVSGGTDFVKYFASMGYLNDGSFFNYVENDLYDSSFNYSRYNWRTNLDFAITPTTTFAVNMSGSYGVRRQPGYRVDGTTESGWNNDAIYSTLYTGSSNEFPLYYYIDTDGDGVEEQYYGVDTDGTGNTVRTNLDRGQRTYKYYQSFIDASLKQDLSMITKGLSATARYSYSSGTETYSLIQRYEGGNFGDDPPAYSRVYDYSSPIYDDAGNIESYEILATTRWGADFVGDRQTATYDSQLSGGYTSDMYYEFALNYNRTFGDHDVTALALMNRNEYNGLDEDSTSNLEYTSKDEAWVVRATYAYKERYMVEVNGAYTGSQKFARGLRFDFFPSYSVGWRISEEPFIKDNFGEILNNLKVRYSYGIVGYDKSATAYSYVQTFTETTTNQPFGYDNTTNYGPMYTEDTLANLAATWETATKQNLGFEFKLFDKLSGTLDLFKEDREGILMSASTPAWTGNTSSNANLGITKSRGFEIELSWFDQVGDDFRYWIKGNFSLNENRIVYRNDAETTAEYEKYAGKSINYISRYIWNGYYTSLDDVYNYTTPGTTAVQSGLIAGDHIYCDYNCDGVIDSFDMAPMDENNYPQKTYGSTIGFGYKNFEVNVLLYGVIDVYKNVATAFIWDNGAGSSGNYYANYDATSRWTEENVAAGTVTKPTQHVTSTYTTYNQYSSTFLFQNASYLRVKNIELSYSFGKEVLSKIGLSKLQVYVNGKNLFVVTDFNSQTDPTQNSTSAYPYTKEYNIGARLSF